MCVYVCVGDSLLGVADGSVWGRRGMLLLATNYAF